MRGFYLEYHPEVNALQVGGTLYDLDGNELSVFETAFRQAYLAANDRVTESRVKDFNYFKIVKELRSNEEVRRAEFAIKCGLLDEFRGYLLPESVGYDALMEELGYGTVNESTITSDDSRKRIKQVLVRLNEQAIQEGLFSGIKKVAQKVGNAVKTVATKAVDTAKTAAKTVAKGAVAVGKQAVKNAVTVGKAVAKGAVAAGKAVVKGVKAVAKVVGKVAKAALQALGKLGGLFLGFLKKIVGFAMNNLSKLIDVLIPLLDKIKPVTKLVPQVGSLLTGAGGVSSVMKALITITGNGTIVNDTAPAAGATPDLNESFVVSTNEAISASLEKKRTATGFIMQGATLLGMAALGKQVDGAMYKGLNDALSAALSAGKGKTESIIPFILKKITLGSIGEKIKSIFLDPSAIVAKILSSIVASVGGPLAIAVKKLWQLLGGEKMVANLIKPLFAKLKDKILELISPNKKAEPEPEPEPEPEVEEEVVEEEPAEEEEVEEEEPAPVVKKKVVAKKPKLTAKQQRQQRRAERKAKKKKKAKAVEPEYDSESGDSDGEFDMA